VTRSVLLLAHTGRENTTESARRVVSRLQEAGVEVRVLAAEADELGLTGITPCTGERGSAAGRRTWWRSTWATASWRGRCGPTSA
jgi:NAD+ kinase